MSQEIANFFWDGEMTNLEKNCIQSFVNAGFKVKLWSYDNIKLPNVESCDANKVLDRKITLRQNSSIKKEAESNLAAFSDYFRYKVVNLFGGWWFDTDCFCLKDVSYYKQIKVGKNIISCKQNDNDDDLYQIGCGAFWMNIETSNNLIKEFEKLIINSKNEIKGYGHYGTEFFTRFVKDNDLYDEILPFEYFYSIHWTESELILGSTNLDKAKERTKDSLLTHIWTYEFESNGIDKNNPKDGSFLKYLYNKANKIDSILI